VEEVVVIVVTVVVTVEAVLEVEVIQAMEDKGIHSLLRKANCPHVQALQNLLRTSSG
jgi:hypothetical protein